MKIVQSWLADLVPVPADVAELRNVADAIALRGFEVAGVETTPTPVIDFEITANRPDCLSHLGLAREASVIWGVPLADRAATLPAPAGDLTVDVEIVAADLCPRYCAQVFEVTIGASPAWLTARLEGAGVRPINTIVDVTNYVMLEIGQPMHAFDLDRVGGGRLLIRGARAGETLRTLDGVERPLDPDMLVIADAGGAIAIAGVMGGSESEISGRTTRIVLESAYFHPRSVRRTSKRLGLKTEASIRFERGGDSEAPPAGLARAAELLAQIGAGTPAGPIVDRYPAPRPRTRILLRCDRIGRLLGVQVPDGDVLRILTPLGFSLREHGDGWMIEVPSFRVDVAREADLIEEVGRHYGFDRIPASFPPLTVAQTPPAPQLAGERTLRQILTVSGFSEAMTFAFIERAAALPFVASGDEPAAIANPLSEMYAVLRPSLLPGLIDSAAHNRRRGRKDIQLFEIGSRFLPGAGEARAAALVWAGAARAPHWSSPTRDVDFFDVAGVAAELGAALRVEVECRSAERSYLAPGRSAELRVRTIDGEMVAGVAGQLAPAIATARGLTAGEDIYVAEIDVARLFAAAPRGELLAEPLPRYPSIVRDLSILVPDTLPAAAVRDTIRASAPSTLAAIVEFDRYSGSGVPPHQVSLSLRLTFRTPDRTLTDADVQEGMSGIIAALRATHGAEQR